MSIAFLKRQVSRLIPVRPAVRFVNKLQNELPESLLKASREYALPIRCISPDPESDTYIYSSEIGILCPKGKAAFILPGRIFHDCLMIVTEPYRMQIIDEGDSRPIIIEAYKPGRTYLPKELRTSREAWPEHDDILCRVRIMPAEELKALVTTCITAYTNDEQ